MSIPKPTLAVPYVRTVLYNTVIRRERVQVLLYWYNHVHLIIMTLSADRIFNGEFHNAVNQCHFSKMSLHRPPNSKA